MAPPPRIELVRIARPQLERLAATTGDTVHLGILDDDRALYLDKVPGSRRVEIGSRIGERHPLLSTGLGKALLLDESEAQWRSRFEEVGDNGQRFADWAQPMKEYAAGGYAFDLEENEDRIRCVAAPVRDASGAIAGAISVSSAAQYMDDARLAGLRSDVIAAAESIGRQLGWHPRGCGKVRWRDLERSVDIGRHLSDA